ncbi:hypothetical protein [Idiomarina sp.]|uniref:hypothetical protein n=1 Tax=Idiomarina sp. TaxID=1874361 RepID=UPI00258A7A32|nr:hypothetical protein [Idiomarina sp.]
MSDWSELDQLGGVAAQADVEETPDLPPTPEEQAEIEQAEREQEMQIPSGQLVEMAISPLFQMFAPNWGVQQQEISALSESYGNLLDKYFPDGMGSRFSVEIAALTCTAMVIAPRLGKPRKKPEPKKKPEGEADEN